MSWTPRVTANGRDGLSTWDSVAATGQFEVDGTVTWPNSCAVTNWIAMIAFPSAGLRPKCVQSTGSATGVTSINTYSQAFAADVVAGNLIVVDIAFNAASPTGTNCFVTDSLGGYYFPVFAGYAAASADFLCCWIGRAKASGPLLIEISQYGASPSPFQAISVAIHEYSGVAGGPATYSFSGTADGTHGYLTAVTPAVPAWVNDCFAEISTPGGLQQITTVFGPGTLGTPSIVLPAGVYTGVVVSPPETWGFVFSPTAATGSGASLVSAGVWALEAANLLNSATVMLTVSSPPPPLMHLIGASEPLCLGPVPDQSGGGNASCFPAWLAINEPGSNAPFGGKYYPALTQRVLAHNFDGVWTWDGISLGIGDQLAAVSQTYTGSQDMLGGIVALRGPSPGFVQGAGSASAANVDVGTFTQAFASGNATGNCLVVDVFGLLDVPDTFAISDSAGNTYVQVYFENTGSFGGGDCWSTFVALNCAAGANTVTITVNGIGSNKAQDWAIAVHEYSGVLTAGAVDSFGVDHVLAATNASAINLNVTTTGTAELIHVAVFTHQYNVAVTTIAVSPNGPGGWVDQSHRLHMAEQATFSWIVKQRGTAKIPLIIAADDPYRPTTGAQVCLWDITAIANFEVFSGTIDDWEIKWLGQNGDRTIELTCVSFESIFDELRTPEMLFIDQTAGFIFTILAARAVGAPVSLGAVGPGVTISSFLVSDYPTTADAFTRLATLSEYVWGIDPGTAELYFTPPDVTPAPFTLVSEDVLWEQFTLKEERHDYRNRQIIKVNSNAAVQSSEYFVGVGQLAFTLLRPVDQVTAAWVTQNIQNSATGTFSGQPSPGDTVSFTYASGGGGGFTWVANNTYFVGAIIVDPAGNVQRATIAAAGTASGATQPTWKENYGDITTDFTMSWTCEGPAGFGSSIAALYTFVAVLDNTQFGQVLIDPSGVAGTAQNLADAINSIQSLAGITFSLPTWENPLVNADEPAGASTIVVRNKAAGAAFVAGLAWTGTAFSFNKAVTFGGVTTFGTITVNVGIQGQTSGGSGPTLVYTPGSDQVSLATPLNSGSNLAVQYLAQNAGYIQVEDTAQVILRALIEQSTGKYQQTSSDDNALTLFEGLQLAQQQLAAYGVIPGTFEFTSFQPGLYVGQVLAIAMSEPGGAGGMAALVNGNWFIREINAEMVPIFDEFGTAFIPHAGHYRYTIQCINVTQIGDWLDFWEGLSGGGGSASGQALFPGGGSLGPPSGGGNGFTSAFTAVAGTPLAITHGLNTLSVIAMAYDGSGNQMLFGALTVTSANVITVTFGIGFTGSICILGVA